MNSYSVINYKLRPQKQIERGLIAQLLNDFSRTIGNPINYIGMGSLVFADFIYFNKNCQLQKMISIEKMTDKEGNFDGKKEKRFLNNKPFSTIELISKTVSEAIDEIPLDENAFIWLDYDGQIETTTIDDLENIIKNISVSCIVAVTFNGGIAKQYKSNSIVNIDQCESDFAPYRIEDEKDQIGKFNKDNYSQIASAICEKYIFNRVEFYNDLFDKKLSISKISDIHYQDNAKMITLLWGVIDTESEYAPKLKEKFDSFEAKGSTYLTMDSLTLFEKMQLDRCPYEKRAELIEQIGLDEQTVNMYYKYSRYIPEYSEVLV